MDDYLNTIMDVERSVCHNKQNPILILIGIGSYRTS